MSFFNTIISCVFNKLVEQPTLNQPFITHPKYKFAILIICDIAQLIYSNPGICRSFFQAQITFFPNRNFSVLWMTYSSDS